MAITGVHGLLYSSKPEELRDVLRDGLGLPHVDAGGGWLIFALPPAELGVHPGETPHHEISLMCDDLDATIDELRGKGIVFRDDRQEARWGLTITMLLPGDLPVLLYEPRHPTAI
ncbi:MAG: hypothetical protein QOG45_731 [Chloroflexota bacterium]|jgi:hypothetical protein|nr:hypothetical protein [Chloroflexota bacterium]